MEHVSNLEIHVPMPGDWNRMPGPDLIERIAANGRVVFSVGIPRVFTRVIDRPLSPEELSAFAQALSRPRDSGLNTTVTAAGQVRIPSGLWIWFEVAMANDRAEPLGGATPRLDRFAHWTFATTVAGHLIQVTCGVPESRDETDTQFTRAKRDAGALCKRVIERMTITAQ